MQGCIFPQNSTGVRHTVKKKCKPGNRDSSALCSLGRMSPSFPLLPLSIYLFCLLCLSLTQLRVLGRNPASYAEAHSLPHCLGLPCQPGRLHAAEASWPSSPAPAESQRHVMSSGCPPARSPHCPGPKVGQMLRPWCEVRVSLGLMAGGSPYSHQHLPPSPKAGR